VAANPHTKPVDLDCESAENWQLPSTVHTHHRHCYYYSARKLIFIYRPTEGGKLNRPRHCSKGAQPVPIFFVMEFIERYKWFGWSSTVHSCLFFLCVLLMYIFVLCLMFRPSSVKSSIVLCYNINFNNLLTYLKAVYCSCCRDKHNRPRCVIDEGKVIQCITTSLWYELFLLSAVNTDIKQGYKRSRRFHL